MPEIGELVASDSIPGMTIPEGVRGRVAADHAGEGVTSPTALTFEEEGALYISETHRFRFGVDDNRDRLFWLMDDFASQTVEDRAKMYEKWREKVPLEMMTERSEVSSLTSSMAGNPTRMVASWSWLPKSHSRRMRPRKS